MGRAAMIFRLLPISLIASAALAQNALNQGQSNRPAHPPRGANLLLQPFGVPGRALDANLQVGSSGLNAPIANFQNELALRNAVVTGNVGGGKSFRGDIGYTAAADFRGATAADDLFRFQRDTAYSGLATQNLRGISPLQFQLTETTGGQTQGLLGDFIVRRPAAGATATETINPAAAPPTVDAYGTLRGSLRSTSDFLLRNLRFPRILGGMTEEDGTPRVLAASPLLGVRSLDPRNAAFARQERPDLLGLPAPIPTLDELTRPRPREQPTEAKELPGASKPLAQPFEVVPVFESLRQDLLLKADNYLSKRFDEEAPFSKEEMGPPAPLPPGREPSFETPRQKFDRMMEEMRQSFREKRLKPAAPAEAPGEGPVPAAPAIPGLDKPPAEEPEVRRKTLTPDELIAHARGLFESGEAKLKALLEQEGATDLYSWHMHKGQEAMRAERWFDAEERFSAALRAAPGDPMAAAGRLHAQIAAGMFLSAIVNLRNTFTAYPELIPARYPEDLFVRGESLEGVRWLLHERMKHDTPFARDAALILAYIGWQTGRREDVQEAFDTLDRFRAAAAEQPDALELVLREVWLTAK